MKNILLTFVFFYSISFSQKSQSIELPDFVITGSKSVSVPDVKKNIPEYDPNYSELQFERTAENIELPKLSLPEPTLLKHEIDSAAFIKKGSLNIGAGLYTQPTGNFFLSSGFDHAMLIINVAGINQKDFLPYSRFNKSGLEGGLYFFISPKSNLFPGAKIMFKGNYAKEAYRLYGSNNPMQRRDNDFRGAQITFENFYSNYFNYGINFKTERTDMKSDELQHIRMNIEPEIALKFNSFKMFANASLSTNKIYSLNSEYYSYQKIGGGVDLYLVRSLSLKLGLDYFNGQNSQFIKPYVESIFRFNNYFSVSGNFKPYVIYKSHNEYIEQNRYYNANSINRILENHKFYSELLFLFEYENVLQMQIGLQYDKIDSLVYMFAQNNFKDFMVSTLSNVNLLSSKFNLTLFAGSFGDFYLRVIWKTFFNNGKIYIPQNPDFLALLIYHKELSRKFAFDTKFKFIDGNYYSTTTKEKLPPIIDLGIKLNYSLFSDLNLFADMENVFNKKNYYIRYYQSKPMDIIFGVNYIW